MAKEPEFRAGAYSGLLAAIMVVALSVMAFTALEPPRERPVQTAEAVLDSAQLPDSTAARLRAQR